MIILVDPKNTSFRAGHCARSGESFRRCMAFFRGAIVWRFTNDVAAWSHHGKWEQHIVNDI